MIKIRVLCISVLIAICIITFGFIFMKANRPKGGEGTGMFEFPSVSKITLSTVDGKIVNITDINTIQEIQELCKKDNAFEELVDTQLNNWSCDIWIDFNNTRTVIGMCSNGAYGNLGHEKETNVNFIIDKELYDYLIELLK